LSAPEQLFSCLLLPVALAQLWQGDHPTGFAAVLCRFVQFADFVEWYQGRRPDAAARQAANKTQ
jgi:hypothetical protein